MFSSVFKRLAGTSIVTITIFLYSISTVAAGTKISFWSPYPERKPTFDYVIDAFEKENPGISVQGQYFPVKNFKDKMLLAIPSGTGPDFLETINFWVFPFVDEGYFAPIPQSIVDYLKDRILPEQFPQRGGKHYSVSVFASFSMLYWNKVQFAEIGLEGPPKTFDHMVDYATKLAKYENNKLVRNGISLRLSGNPAGITQKFWALTLIPFDTDVISKTSSGKYRCGFDNEVGRKGLQTYINLLWKYHAVDPQLKQDAESFALGISAMFEREAWVSGYLKKTAPDLNYGIAYLPRGTSDGTMIALGGLHIPKASKNKQAVEKFIQFFVQSEYQELMQKQSGWLLPREDLNFDKILEDFPELRRYMEDIPEDYKWHKYSVAVEDRIHVTVGNGLSKAFFRRDLVDNPEGIAKVIGDIAEKVNNVLREAGLY